MTPTKPSPPAPSDPDLRPILDAELERLPDKYRVPVILCYLEGKTNDEAAAALGWTRGTVAGRLSRARDLLRDRLARRGVALSAGGLAVAVTEAGACAAVPTALCQTTSQAAWQIVTGQGASIAAPIAVLVDAALTSLRLARLRTTAAVLLVVALVGAGTAIAAWKFRGGTAPAGAPEPDVVYLADLAETRLNVPGPEHFEKGGTVKGILSPRTLALHPPTSGSSAVTYTLDKKYQKFEAAVGIRDNPHGARKTPVIFVVLGDGKELWKSGPFREPGKTEECTVNIQGIDQLELLVRCPGPSVYAWSAWVDPRVSK